jgi:hypothetical protein
MHHEIFTPKLLSTVTPGIGTHMIDHQWTKVEMEEESPKSPEAQKTLKSLHLTMIFLSNSLH